LEVAAADLDYAALLRELDATALHRRRHRHACTGPAGPWERPRYRSSLHI